MLFELDLTSLKHWNFSTLLGHSVMRLIKCSDKSFEEYTGQQHPAYAILSHTWDAEEVTFRDFYQKNPRKSSGSRQKVLDCCERALKDDLAYLWVDTCCIDKSSSAELSEAINSMFTWYADSTRCYVYLNDFDTKDRSSDLTKCRWFTRGWTLQELIAPVDCRFYDKYWRYIGSKSELCSALCTITGTDNAPRKYPGLMQARNR
jgi:hypothetical protein